tara:strand:- start:260 stop:478 length:219 start_codon:yes stop_codon:yes gene_type:complete
MSTRRDYVPSREKNLKERMDSGASLSEGLAGRTEVQKDGARYRTYVNADGSEDYSKKYQGNGGFMVGDSDDC